MLIAIQYYMQNKYMLEQGPTLKILKGKCRWWNIIYHMNALTWNVQAVKIHQEGRVTLLRKDAKGKWEKTNKQTKNGC